MASTTSYFLHGDREGAINLRGFAQQELMKLRIQMSFNGLGQDRRSVRFQDGSIVECTSVFGVETVNLYAPEVVVTVPVHSTREITETLGFPLFVLNGRGGAVWYLFRDKEGVLTVYRRGGYFYTLEKNELGESTVVKWAKLLDKDGEDTAEILPYNYVSGASQQLVVNYKDKTYLVSDNVYEYDSFPGVIKKGYPLSDQGVVAIDPAKNAYTMTYDYGYPYKYKMTNFYNILDSIIEDESFVFEGIPIDSSSHAGLATLNNGVFNSHYGECSYDALFHISGFDFATIPSVNVIGAPKGDSKEWISSSPSPTAGDTLDEDKAYNAGTVMLGIRLSEGDLWAGSEGNGNSKCEYQSIGGILTSATWESSISWRNVIIATISDSTSGVYRLNYSTDEFTSIQGGIGDDLSDNYYALLTSNVDMSGSLFSPNNPNKGVLIGDSSCTTFEDVNKIATLPTPTESVTSSISWVISSNSSPSYSVSVSASLLRSSFGNERFTDCISAAIPEQIVIGDPCGSTGFFPHLGGWPIDVPLGKPLYSSATALDDVLHTARVEVAYSGYYKPWLYYELKLNGVDIIDLIPDEIKSVTVPGFIIFPLANLEE